LAAFVATVAGCGSDGKQVPYYHDTRVNAGEDTIPPPGTNYPDEAFVPRTNPSEKWVNLTGEVGTAFRDAASFTYVDRAGMQWLWQDLLTMDGTTYFERSCPIDDNRGPVWARCEAWSPGYSVAHTATQEEAFSGMGGFVFRTTNNVQILAQTAFNLGGDTRIGRTCPIGVYGDGKRPDWNDCSPWDKLIVYSPAFEVPGQALLRDDLMYTYTDVGGNQVFAQIVLAVDGSISWQRNVATVPELLGTTGGKWSPPQHITSLGLYGGTLLSGWSGYVYTSGGNTIFAQTVISSDGTRSARRECSISNGPPVPSSCSHWSYGSLDGILKVNAPL
jgi:hypothetical protein